ncbi:MAG: DUF58 domain-containing protein [Pseudobdellovibrionaceae bacterium]
MVIRKNFYYQKIYEFLKRFERPLRTYIIPTPFGFATGILVVLLLFLAFVYSNNLVYAAVFFIASFCIQNMVRCAQNIEKLYIVNITEKESFANEDFICTFEIENKGRWEIIDSEIFSPQLSQPIKIPFIAPKQLEQISATIKFKKRGWSKISQLQILSLYPFEMFKSWKKVQFDQEILIFPEKKGLSLFQIDQAQPLAEDSDEFLNHEVYNGNQSFLRIDWKVFARIQKLMVKKYGSGVELNTDFTWEQTEYLMDSESRISQLTLWIDECHKKNIEFSLKLPHQFFKKSSQSGHYFNCLKELATWKI